VCWFIEEVNSCRSNKILYKSKVGYYFEDTLPNTPNHLLSFRHGLVFVVPVALAEGGGAVRVGPLSPSLQQAPPPGSMRHGIPQEPAERPH